MTAEDERAARTGDVVAAVLRPGVPAQLAGVLRLYADECRGVRRPAGVPRPRMTPELAGLCAAVARLAEAEAAGSVADVSVSRLTVPEAARLLGVTPGRVRQLIYDGTLSGDQVGRMWLIDPVTVESRRAS